VHACGDCVLPTALQPRPAPPYPSSCEQGAAGGASPQAGRIGEYQDEVHAEGMEGIEIVE